MGRAGAGAAAQQAAPGSPGGGLEEELLQSLNEQGLYEAAQKVGIVGVPDALQDAGTTDAAVDETEKDVAAIEQETLVDRCQTTSQLAGQTAAAVEVVLRQLAASDPVQPASVMASHDDQSNQNNSTPANPRKRRATGQSVAQKASQWDSAKGGKGLRDFARKVCNVLVDKRTTTYNEVADELVKELTAEPSSQFEEKNIRRRVYDALNVLMAMDIIRKERKMIHWRGLPNESAQTSRDEYRAKIEVSLRQVNQKRHELNGLTDTYRAMRALVARNSKLAQGANAVPREQCLSFPFLCVHTRQDPHENRSTFRPTLEIAQDHSEVLFEFGPRRFQMQYDCDLLAEVVLGLRKNESGDNPSSER
ncbi:unnamed protein product [Pedinophyceae sp. YPF-701]|nr:unnamed protein product [Pedinophyceae sp. YPF-701]